MLQQSWKPKAGIPGLSWIQKSEIKKKIKKQLAHLNWVNNWCIFQVCLVCQKAGSNVPENLQFSRVTLAHGGYRNSLPPGITQGCSSCANMSSQVPCVPLQCLGSIGITLEKALKGYQAVRGKGGERKEQEGAGEPQFSYNHQIKSQGGGGFSRSSDLKAGEWKEEEAHLHRSSVRASSGRGSALLALCYLQGHAHTYSQLNKHRSEVQSRPMRENIIRGNL